VLHGRSHNESGKKGRERPTKEKTEKKRGTFSAMATLNEGGENALHEKKGDPEWLGEKGGRKHPRGCHGTPRKKEVRQASPKTKGKKNGRKMGPNQLLMGGVSQKAGPQPKGKEIELVVMAQSATGWFRRPGKLCGEREVHPNSQKNGDSCL